LSILLLTVNDASGHLSCYTSRHASIWHCYRDMAPQKQQGYYLDLLGLRDVIGHVTIRFAVGHFL